VPFVSSMRAVLAALFLSVAGADGLAQEVTGGVRPYDVLAGDTLGGIGARFGIEPRTLARDNALPPNGLIRRGDRLLIDNRHVAPAPAPDGILLNVPQRMLFLYRDSVLVLAVPVAVGRPDWPTPLGAYQVAIKETDPVWDVPPSIQQEMAEQKRRVVTKVPPGPDNPLGAHWLGLSAPAVGIHGTNQPSSIYRFTTHGCIRVHPDDMRELFDLAAVGMSVEIVYQPVLLGRDQDGVPFLEVHRDTYGKGGPPEARANELLRAAGLDWLIGSPLVRRALDERAGRAVAIVDE
jgi:L,D-transpeptidase ErfK/SrfK